MADTNTVTALEPAPVRDQFEVSDDELESIVGGATIEPCCTNVACEG